MFTRNTHKNLPRVLRPSDWLGGCGVRKHCCFLEIRIQRRGLVDLPRDSDRIRVIGALQVKAKEAVIRDNLAKRVRRVLHRAGRSAGRDNATGLDAGADYDLAGGAGVQFAITAKKIGFQQFAASEILGIAETSNGDGEFLTGTGVGRHFRSNADKSNIAGRQVAGVEIVGIVTEVFPQHGKGSVFFIASAGKAGDDTDTFELDWRSALNGDKFTHRLCLGKSGEGKNYQC